MKLIHKDLKILSIKNFYKPSFFSSKRVNDILEENCELYLDLSAGNNYPIIKNNQDLFFVKLVSKFQNTCERIFKPYDVDHLRYRNVIYCYRSTENHYCSDFHDHLRTTTINGVYYYDINDGDSISFLTPDNTIFTYSMEKYELLIFPDYVVHRPEKPSGSKVRYSLNMELPTFQPSNFLFNFN